MRTASILGDPTPNAAWREFGIGDWEGMTSAEIVNEHPGQLEAFLRGEDIAPGGGEQMSAFRRRVVGAFEAVAASIPDGGHGVVVTHGGVIWAIIAHVLGMKGGVYSMVPSHNTASTRIRIGVDGYKQLFVFNDASHLADVPTQYGPEGTTVSIYRHGQTEGNLAGRWQGRTDSPLTAEGREQVKAASVVAPKMNALFTSPLGRTVETASIIGDAIGVSPNDSDGLMEMAFGSWENMTIAEAVADDPELFDRIYNRGEDVPRGGDGESFAQAGERVHATVESLATNSDVDYIGAVSHGAAIRAYITSVVGVSFAKRDRFPIPRNSSMSQVRQTSNGPVLAAYNVAPHLDE
jgi:broad specificity phosphatase PhoE